MTKCTKCGQTTTRPQNRYCKECYYEKELKRLRKQRGQGDNHAPSNNSNETNGNPHETPQVITPTKPTYIQTWLKDQPNITNKKLLGILILTFITGMLLGGL